MGANLDKSCPQRIYLQSKRKIDAGEELTFCYDSATKRGFTCACLDYNCSLKSESEDFSSEVESSLDERSGEESLSLTVSDLETRLALLVQFHSSNADEYKQVISSLRAVALPDEGIWRELDQPRMLAVITPNLSFLSSLVECFAYGVHLPYLNQMLSWKAELDANEFYLVQTMFGLLSPVHVLPRVLPCGPVAKNFLLDFHPSTFNSDEFSVD